MDERLGQYSDNGAVWPKVDIRGNAYERGVGATAGVGGGHFVVLPPGYIDDRTLEALRAQFQPPTIEVGEQATIEEDGTLAFPAQKRRRKDTEVADESNNE